MARQGLPNQGTELLLHNKKEMQMKKYLLISIAVLGMVGSAHAEPSYVQKRRNIAIQMVQADIQLIDVLGKFEQLISERNSLGGANDFLDSDFVGGGPSDQFLVQLDSYTAKVMLGDVATAFIALYKNVSLNRDIMNKVKP